jgi:hypothetical protein
MTILVDRKTKSPLEKLTKATERIKSTSPSKSGKSRPLHARKRDAGDFASEEKVQATVEEIAARCGLGL